MSREEGLLYELNVNSGRGKDAVRKPAAANVPHDQPREEVCIDESLANARRDALVLPVNGLS